MNPTKNAKKPTKAGKETKKKSSTSSSTPSDPAANTNKSPPPEETKFLGCYGGEVSFIERIYDGGSSGANYNLALHHAKTNRKRYFAIARGGSDGHSFSFSSLDTSKGTLNSGGCDRPCLDYDEKVCGCIDGACTGPTPKGK